MRIDHGLVMASPSRSEYVTLQANDATGTVEPVPDPAHVDTDHDVRSEEKESLKAPLMQDLKANYNTFYGSSPAYSAQCDIFTFEGQTQAHSSHGMKQVRDNHYSSQISQEDENVDPRLSTSNHKVFRRGVYSHLKQLWALVPPVWRSYGKTGSIKASGGYSDIWQLELIHGNT